MRVTNDRLLSKPSLIPFLDGLYDRASARGSTPAVRARKSAYASSNLSKSETSEVSSSLPTSELEPELSLSSSSELLCAFSSFLGVKTALLQQSSHGSAGVHTGVRSNKSALACFPGRSGTQEIWIPGGLATVLILLLQGLLHQLDWNISLMRLPSTRNDC